MVLTPCVVTPVTPSLIDADAWNCTLPDGPKTTGCVPLNTMCEHQMPHAAPSLPTVGPVAPAPAVAPELRRPARPVRLSATFCSDGGSLVYQPANDGTPLAASPIPVHALEVKFGSAVVVEPAYTPG